MSKEKKEEPNEFEKMKAYGDISTWDRLTESEKEEIKKKAAEKRRLIEVARIKLERDISLGKQKTILNSW